MAATATARRSREARRPASGDVDGGGNGASTAAHFHQYDVPVECEAYVRCRLYAAKDVDGKWFASDSLQIGRDQVRESVLKPYTAPKFESEAAALRAAAGVVERWLALEADAYRDVAPAIGQAVHEWVELVHKHVTARDLAGEQEVAAARRKDGGSAASESGIEVPHSKKRTIVEVALDSLHRHPSNREVSEQGCKLLAKDIERRGVLSPIQIRDPGPSWQLPQGHWQIVFGERRVVAARLAGLATIPAEIVTLTDAQTQEAIAAENGHREPLNDMERARRLAELTRSVEEGGGGLTQTAAAAVLGIDQSTASTLQKLTQLPRKWRDLVIAGEITGSQLRPVLDYVDCPAILEMFRNDFEEARKSKWAEEVGAWATRAAIEQTVQNLLIDRTRPVGKNDLLENEQHWVVPSFDAAAAAGELDVIELPDGQRRALDIKRWQELQHAAKRTNGRAKEAYIDATTKNKPSLPKPKLTPAEARKQEAVQDRDLAERIRRPGGLAEQGLRWAMAARITEILRTSPGGTEATHQAGQVLADAARESSGSSDLDYTAWRYLAWRLIRAGAAAKGESFGQISGYKNHEAYARYTLATLGPVNDYVTAGLEHLALMGRLILYPSDERIHEAVRLTKWGDWPDRWTWIDQGILADLAEGLGASLLQTWTAARRPGAARRWMELLVTTHNTRRQRVGLAEELEVATSSEDSMEQVKEAILTAHTGRLLRTPAVLKDFAKPKRRGPKGKKG